MCSMNRQALIARKHEVRRRLERAQRELEQLQTLPPTWRTRRRIGGMQQAIDRLMAEEHTLRLAIDRSS